MGSQRSSSGDLEERGALLAARAAASPAEGGEVPDKGLAGVIVPIIISAMGAFAFGYHLGVINGPLEVLAADLGIAGDAAKTGSIVSTVLAGAAIGSFTGGSLADSLGRKRALIANSVPLFLGAFLCATATSLNVMLAGRAIAGLGIGIASALVPLFISEVSPPSIRGALGSTNQLSICLGILGALVINVVLPATAWRTMMGAAMVPAAVLGLGMLLLSPESPRWLQRKGRAAEAAQAAEKLWGSDAALQGGESGAGSDSSSGSFFELFAKYRKATVIGGMLFLIQQFGGINAIVYFSSAVFSKAGVASATAASAAVGLVNVLGTVVAGGLMDKAGRVQLLSGSLLGMSACMILQALSMQVPALAPLAAPIALVGTLGYVLAFALGAGPCPALLSSEIFPARVRGSGVAWCMGVHWVTNFAIGQFFLAAVQAFGVPAVYMFFATVCAAGAAYVRAFVIETKGKSLEQIEMAMSS
ncbi:unnamed protein product [Pedinophyceae sp. YPF-701]|nr:unnamed protein product [Pedinophyceae sp. YPF-701]